jgi:carbamoylphosphate synthase small subunit
MIVKTKHGYVVKSEEGKNLSKDDLTKEQAQRRLYQIEFFKHHPEAHGKK